MKVSQDHLDHGTVKRLHKRFGKQLAWCATDPRLACVAMLTASVL